MTKNGEIKLDFPSYRDRESFEWTRRARIVAVDAYQPPFYPDANYDAKAIVDLAKELEANLIRVSAMAKKANFYTDQWETDEYIKNNDFLKDLIDRAHIYGIRVVPYIPAAVHLPLDLVKKWHPEWVQLSYPHQPIDETADIKHSGTMNTRVCPIGYYKSYYMHMLDEVIIKHDVDGWYTDGWKDSYFKPKCYCESCRKGFMDDTGNDIYSPEFAPDKPRSEEIRKWYSYKLVKFVQDVHASVLKHKKIPSMINTYGIWGPGSEGTWGHDIDPIHDVYHYERKVDPYNRLVSASYLSIKGQKAWFYAGLYSPLQFNGPEGAEENYADELVFPYRKELYNECLIVFACNQGVNNQRANSFLFDKESPGKKIVKDIYATVRNNPYIFEGTQYHPFIGVLNREKSVWEYKDERLISLVKSGIQATMLMPCDLDSVDFLNKFTVLITDNTDNEESTKIRDFVKQGGLWVTTGEAFSDKITAASQINSPEGMKAFILGRGLIVQVDKSLPVDNLLEAVLFATGGYCPYKVKISQGEVIPILTEKHGAWILHLVNITNHLTKHFDQGLEYIPEIDRVEIEVSLPEGVSIKKSRLLRDNRDLQWATVDGRDILRTEVNGLKEYEAVIIELGG